MVYLKGKKGDGRAEKEAVDEAKVRAILKATGVRDDARFLARVAFGIGSPRVTAERLGKSEVFGCLAGCGFEVSWMLIGVVFLRWFACLWLD